MIKTELVKKRIKEMINEGTLKVQGIKKLKKEFGLHEKECMKLWLEVKSNNAYLQAKTNANFVECNTKINNSNVTNSDKRRGQLYELNRSLFNSLNALDDKKLSNEELKMEILKAKAKTDIAKNIIDNANLMLKAATFKHKITGKLECVTDELFGGEND